MLSQEQIDELEQALETLDRAAQAKRQEKIDEAVALRSLRDELDSVKVESVGAGISLQNAKTTVSILAGEVTEKEKQLDLFHSRVKEIKDQLLYEKNAIQDKEKINSHANERLKLTEKEVKIAEAKIDKLREHVFKESNNLATLREKESSLLSEIKSTKVNTDINLFTARIDRTSLRSFILILSPQKSECRVQ
jgi:chromosome segregation ATPase